MSNFKRCMSTIKGEKIEPADMNGSYETGLGNEFQIESFSLVSGDAVQEDTTRLSSSEGTIKEEHINAIKKKIKSETEGISVESSEETIPSRASVLIESKRDFSCNSCNESFVVQDQLDKHLTVHVQDPVSSNVQENIVSVKCNFVRPLVKYNPIRSGKNIYTCSICNKCFYQKGHLTEHSRVHSGEKPFACSICCKSFSHKSTLANHIAIHADEKPFACSVCNDSFPRRGQLTEHSRIHFDEKPFTCGVCLKSFSRKGNLNKHRRLHSGEKPFVCGICQKSFSRKSHLTEHSNIHSGKKLITCNICQRSFSQKSSLVRHLNIHSGKN